MFKLVFMKVCAQVCLDFFMVLPNLDHAGLHFKAAKSSTSFVENKQKSFLPLSIVLPEQSSYLLFFQEVPLVTSRRGVKSSLIGRDLPSLCNEGMTKY